MHPGFQILQHSTAHKLLAEPISRGENHHPYPTVYIFQAQNGSFQFHFQQRRIYQYLLNRVNLYPFLPIPRDPGNRLKRLNRASIG